MIKRYTRPEMGRLWTDQTKYETWLVVELAVVEALVHLGELTRQEADDIRYHAKFSISRIEKIEAEIQHDLQAFVQAVQEQLREDGLEERVVGAFHKKTTSYDTEDPAFMLILGRTADQIRDGLVKLREALLAKAWEHKDTLMVARTHGQDAQPDTFGRLLLVFVNQCDSNLRRLDYVKANELNKAKLSGAVGNYANVSPGLEAAALKILGLEPDPVATQIIQRDRHSTYADVLATIASCIEQMCRTLWEMMRSGVGELEEGRTKNQKGSSAMAHKKNPIKTEQLQGMGRKARACALTLKENIVTPECRAIEQSCVERMDWPDLTILVDYMLVAATKLINKLVVDAGRMKFNLNNTFGIWASQSVRNALIDAGVPADKAYTYVQGLSFDAVRRGHFLFDLLETRSVDGAGKTGLELIGAKHLSQMCDPQKYIQAGVNAIFERFAV